MRKLIMWNLITLDGSFEGAKPWDLDWHEQVWGEELKQLSLEQLATADALVFGRVTYEGMAAYWTGATGEIADYMNRLPKIACSRTLASAAWNNTTLLKHDVAGDVARLKEQGDGNMFVFGSGDLSRTLMKANLFDEIRLAIVPVVLGGGRLLFGDGAPPRWFRLLESRAHSTGVVLLRYVPRTASPDAVSA